MVTNWLRAAFACFLLLLACGCAPKPAPAPPPPAPPPKQSVVVLLPDPEGKPGGIAVTNPAGSQTLTEPYQAVRVERSNTAPTPPFAMDQAEVRRVFGAVLDALPSPEVAFTLYFDLNSDALTPDSQDQLRVILNTIQERHSTAISVIGHTDTKGEPQSNEGLARRRAEAVAAILRGQGVDEANLSVESHGDADLAVKTDRGVDEPRNRRVQVIVR
jgi:outer membrane protein OmpA-like peptidoglycan-associated protein